MRWKNTFGGQLQRSGLAILMGTFVSATAFAGVISDHESSLTDDEVTERPFKIENRAQFACAEVSMSQTGGTTSHEINLGPKRVERCELVKVGTRLHECRKYKFKKSTVDDRGVVSIETVDGPVQFWYDEETRVTGMKNTTQLKEGSGRGTLTFTWPDKSKKYLCAAMH